ncbi:MAG: SDR family NAD(P)-dependent oxidoreductase, partial [Planctomycetota bacterium]
DVTAAATATNVRQKIQDLNREEISRIVGYYGDAAARIREAGFDAVELHMAHAYTLSSFLSRRNDRHDEFGGRSIDNRLRVPSRVLRRVREVVGDDYVVGVRFDGEEAIKGGYSVADSSVMAVRFARLGADYVSISAGGKFEDAVRHPGEPLYPYTGYSGDRCMPSAGYPDALNVYLSEAIRAALRERGHQTPVVATGKIRTPELAERILQTGRADLVGLGRQLLADPDWPRKVREGRADSVVQCVYNNVCKALDERFHRVRCTLWRRRDLHAPAAPTDRTPPHWPGGAELTASPTDGRVRLEWTPATDDTGVYGYMILRAEPDTAPGSWKHVDSARGVAHRHEDPSALGGVRYRYRVSPTTSPATARSPWGRWRSRCRAPTGRSLRDASGSGPGTSAACRAGDRPRAGSHARRTSTSGSIPRRTTREGSGRPSQRCVPFRHVRRRLPERGDGLVRLATDLGCPGRGQRPRDAEAAFRIVFRPMAEHALVTGGETGIGAAVTAALKKEGFDVTTASRRTGVDLTDRAAVETLVASLERLDLLVNNAGMAESAPLRETADELWDRHLALNATAPFLLCRAVLPLLRRSPRPRIVNIASTAALRGGRYISAYAASKHALLGLCRSLAAELEGVAVHAVLPGYVDSPLTDRTVERITARTGRGAEETRALLASQNRSGALIRPEEVAAAVVSLLAEEGTGREIVLE